jgi:RimJ/RimL family protein N-acetyltransferase
MIVYDTERLGQWLLDRIDYVECWQPGHQCIGLEIGGEIRAVAVFENYTGHDIDMSVGIESKGGSRAFLRSIFAYPFRQLACRRLSCEVRSKDRDTQRFVQNAGFVIEGRKRDATPSGDLIQYGMRRSECRFL